jgi:ubiquinone/menaquinone biosynthesis C-methylase UbiE
MSEHQQDFRADYVAIHQRNYERIARGEQEGWSSEDDVRDALAYMDLALRLPEAPRAGRLLELGAGDGCMTVPLAQRYPQFTLSGIEIVPLAVELARSRADKAGVDVDLRQGSVLECPWEDGSFDVLFDGHCLHCIVLDDRRRFFGEAWRLLRPGGLLLIDTMAGDPPAGMCGAFDPETRAHHIDGIAGRTYAPVEQILAEITGAGFRVLTYHVEFRHDPSQADSLISAALKPVA